MKKKNILAMVICGIMAFNTVATYNVSAAELIEDEEYVEAYEEEYIEDSAEDYFEDHAEEDIEEQRLDINEDDEESVDLVVETATDTDVTDKVDYGYSNVVIYDNVAIDEKNFEDPIFREYVKNNFDTDKNLVLSESECFAVKIINVERKGISSLKGIEVFIGLRELYCANNKIKKLDLTNNILLGEIDCKNNEIETINFARTEVEVSLYCSKNKLQTLSVRRLCQLQTLDCSDNQLTEIDVSDNEKLMDFRCKNNKLKSLDVRTNHELKCLYCPDNNISSLEIGQNDNLEELACSYNNIYTLDISKVPNLNFLVCSYNKLRCLDISNNPKLISGVVSARNNVCETDRRYFYFGKIPGFDVSKMSNISGGVLNLDYSEIFFNTEDGKVTYIYDCGNNISEKFEIKCTSDSFLDIPQLENISNENDGVKVSWKKVTGAKKYRVYRKISSGSWVKIGETASTTFLDKKAEKGVKYTYTVRVINSRTGKTISYYDRQGISVTRLVKPVISSINNTSAGVKLGWSGVNGATKYRVYRKLTGGKWGKIADISTTSYVDTSVKKGMTYYYTVKAIAKDGSVSKYDTAGKKINTPQLAKPVLNSPAKTTTGVKVSWGKVAGAEKYRVFRKTGSGSWTRIGNTTSTSYVDTTAVKGRTYTYTVRCISNDGKYYTSSYDTVGKTITYK